MAERHPYSPGPGGITAAITQFRNSFPTTVNAETLKQLAIAPKNESYVINVLRYIGAIDKEGKQTQKALTVFSHHDDADFQKDFAAMVKEAYSDLFTLHKDAAWELPANKLIGFFRTTDKTTALVGKLQAATFQLLAAFAGHGEVPEPAAAKPPAKAKASKAAEAKPAKIPKEAGQAQIQNGGARDVGLTVRIEVNLPAAGDQETYDKIFRSIRENLLNAPKS
ncbi:MAG TPA: DUF5343 domain-containing protein [Candidatus Acidoferrum sp.]|nr:DUF5343 domain-containing protein [Candidatus Acidoferrum sp.]